MHLNIERVEVQPRPLIAVSGPVDRTEISKTLLARLGVVWEFIRANKVENTGHNFAVYQCEGGGLCLTAGVEVTGEFHAPSPLEAAATPAGFAATAAYFGPYSNLGLVNAAIETWCAQHGYETAGVSWELYGHWNENPDECRTDVFYLLK